jgi:hypothetical protein
MTYYVRVRETLFLARRDVFFGVHVFTGQMALNLWAPHRRGRLMPRCATCRSRLAIMVGDDRRLACPRPGCPGPDATGPTLLEIDHATQVERVRDSLRLSDSLAERHGCYARRTKPPK